MPPVSLRTKTLLGNFSKVRTAIIDTTVEEQNEVPDVVMMDLQDNSGANKKKLYSRGLQYSDRYQRKLNQKNREMAKGSAKISSYFFSQTQPVVEEIQVESELDKIKAAYQKLSADLGPVIDARSNQQKSGTYEYAKYRAVHHYLGLRIQGIKLMEASMIAAKACWYDKATTYRSRVIRRYAKEYISTGVIMRGFQGKHSKRVSVLDDNDIKRKVIEWFLSVPKFQRNIAGIQNQLRTVILPSLIESDTLNDDVYVDGVVKNPLSDECIRKKLIEWGFEFQRVGKS